MTSIVNISFSRTTLLHGISQDSQPVYYFDASTENRSKVVSIREVPSSIFIPDTECPEFFRGFTLPKENSWTIPFQYSSIYHTKAPCLSTPYNHCS